MLTQKNQTSSEYFPTRERPGTQNYVLLALFVINNYPEDPNTSQIYFYKKRLGLGCISI